MGFIPILGLQLIHVSKRGYNSKIITDSPVAQRAPVIGNLMLPAFCYALNQHQIPMGLLKRQHLQQHCQVILSLSTCLRTWKHHMHVHYSDTERVNRLISSINICPGILTEFPLWWHTWHKPMTWHLADALAPDKCQVISNHNGKSIENISSHGWHSTADISMA